MGGWDGGDLEGVMDDMTLPLDALPDGWQVHEIAFEHGAWRATVKRPDHSMMYSAGYFPTPRAAFLFACGTARRFTRPE
jgi:hypothetical protein